jgi:hypothetical protein
MGHSKSRCDTIIALIYECLAGYDAALVDHEASRPRRFAPCRESVMTPSYLVNA